jgi:hypothetical protein
MAGNGRTLGWTASDGGGDGSELTFKKLYTLPPRRQQETFRTARRDTTHEGSRENSCASSGYFTSNSGVAETSFGSWNTQG